jgi:hypothetical protein
MPPLVMPTSFEVPKRSMIILQDSMRREKSMPAQACMQTVTAGQHDMMILTRVYNPMSRRSSH